LTTFNNVFFSSAEHLEETNVEREFNKVKKEKFLWAEKYNWYMKSESRFFTPRWKPNTKQLPQTIIP